jgi:hypothetical protein
MQQIAEWLKELGMSEYARCFVSHPERQRCISWGLKGTPISGANGVSGHHLNLDPDAATSARFMNSQVAQEVQYILLVGCAQHVELSDHLVGFRAAARMLLDGSDQVVSAPVMQEEDALPDTP